jgi:AcrR family transcriptional regulator
MDSKTRTRILQATLHHIALYGEDRLSMSGVADEAGLSRGTVYRYFTNRDELLDAVAEHVRTIFTRGVADAAAQGGTSTEKLERVLSTSIDEDTRVAVRRLRELQPAFTLNFLTVHMPDFVRVFTTSFATDFELGDYGMSLDDFAQLMARITVTGTLFYDDADEVKSLIMSIWDIIQPPHRKVSRRRPVATSA